ncbi:MAG: SUMF1/EgtB/PvdO family nonheme iron enzyme [Candidatus Sumerlaeota bacterium]|nr:SUMF1/EgtB/PvdO family nonheme iron enzyme [Candidatus Sumerlaeota bacterium]
MKNLTISNNEAGRAASAIMLMAFVFFTACDKSERDMPPASGMPQAAAYGKGIAESNYVEDLGGGVTMKMLWIKGGTFEMGSPFRAEDMAQTFPGATADSFASELPLHSVTLDGFWMGETEVTQAQYEKIMKTNPAKLQSADRPVECVSWDEAMNFCNQLTTQSPLAAKSKLIYTLPTEAQWEYACRAGTKTLYSWGNRPDDGRGYCNGYDETGKRAHSFPWPNFNYNDGFEGTAPVKSFRPNPWGLYDMHGNVWEWCSDWYADDYYKKQVSNNPNGPDAGERRALRGGSWYDRPFGCRSIQRGCRVPTDHSFYVGFRVIAAPRAKP